MTKKWQSRNQREGSYAGWALGLHRRFELPKSKRVKSFTPIPSFLIARAVMMRKLGRYKLAAIKRETDNAIKK